MCLAAIQAASTLSGWSARWSRIEGVEQVVVAFEVRGCDGDELPVARRGRVRRRARQQQSVAVAGDQRGGHEQGRCIAGARAGQDGGDGGLVAADQPAEQRLGLIGHVCQHRRRR